jgi:type II secretion system protein H
LFARDKSAARQNGFTLIEVMVVLVILGIASAAVVLMLPDPGGRVRDAGEQLAARALAVRDDAILAGRSTRMVIDAAGYSAERRVAGRWRAYGGKGLDAVVFPAGVVAATGAAERVIVTFDATGGVAEPVVIDLSKDAVVVRIDIPANGAVRVT